MPVHRIDHVNLNSSDVARTCAFYVDVLGFEARPMDSVFAGSRGAWLYLDGQAFVHLAARAPQASPDVPLVDHFALSASDLESMRQRLSEAGVAFRESAIPKLGLHQIFIQDPDGVKIELNFASQEA